MSHYIPSPQNYALVYYVNLFYKFFIPITLGSMALLVVMDAGRMLINRSRQSRKSARQAKGAAAGVEPFKEKEIPAVTDAAVALQPAETEEPAFLPQVETKPTESTGTEAEAETKPGATGQSSSKPPDEINSSDSEVEHG